MFKKIGESFIKVIDNIEKMRYKKFISHYYSPKMQTDRIAKEVQGLIEFDLTNDRYELHGRLTKRFVMLDKSYIQELVDEVKNESSHYVTYIENEDIKADQIPSNIAALLKKLNNRQLNAEIMGSKVMNYFGTDTVYNFAIKNYEDRYLASVDFIKPKEEFVGLHEYDENNKFYAGLKFSRIENEIRNIIKRIKLAKFAFANKENVDKIVEEILYVSAIKKYIMGDFDIRAGNFGLLLKNHKIRLAPAYDFDTAFMRRFMPYDDLKYLHDNHLVVYNRFKERFDAFIKKDSNGNAYYSKLSEIAKATSQILENLESNISAIAEALEVIEKQRQKG